MPKYSEVAGERAMLETLSSCTDFAGKASLYPLYFNLAVPPSHKRGLTLRQIIPPRDWLASSCFLGLSSPSWGDTIYPGSPPDDRHSSQGVAPVFMKSSGSGMFPQKILELREGGG
jgi:hypothetical protein